MQALAQDIRKLESLMRAGQWRQARKLVRQLIRRHPDRYDLINAHGGVLMGLNEPKKAKIQFEMALKADPDYVPALDNLGNLHHKLGDSEAAIETYRRVLRVAPQNHDAYRKLALSKRFRTENDPDLAALLAAAAKLTEPAQQRSLLFALGKAFDDLGQYSRAFGYFERGNAIARANSDYDVRRDVALMSNLAKWFAGGWTARNLGAAPCPEGPVFVTGMPRSGTTLIEELLHQRLGISPRGELPCLGRVFDRFSRRNPLRFSAGGLADLALDTRARLGREYLECADVKGPQSKKIIDKTPFNFRLIGFALAIFSTAKIVVCRRRAGAIAFSNYSRDFTGGLRWSYDLRDLARYYAAFEALVGFWSGEPQCDFQVVEYEKLVAETDAVLLTLARGVGLPMNKSAHNKPSKRRLVATASAMQVREKINPAGLDHWRAYKAFLSPFFAELEKARRSPFDPN